MVSYSQPSSRFLRSLSNRQCSILNFCFLLLAILFDLNGLLIQHLTVETLYFCRKLPPQTRKVTIRVALMDVIAGLFGFAIPLMFLIFDLVTLASVSAIIWFFSVVASLILVFKPMKEFRKRH